MNNQSIAQSLRTGVMGMNSNLDVKTYCTTEDYRHALDYRLVLTFKGKNILDLDCICRKHYDRTRTNKTAREERDEYVERMLSRLIITKKKGK